MYQIKLGCKILLNGPLIYCIFVIFFFIVL